MLREITQRRPHQKLGPSRWQMLAAFTSGMVITAALVFIPAAAGVSPTRSIHEPAVPALPDVPSPLKHSSSPDASSPPESGMKELVYAPVEKSVLPC